MKHNEIKQKGFFGDKTENNYFYIGLYSAEKKGNCLELTENIHEGILNSNDKATQSFKVLLPVDGILVDAKDLKRGEVACLPFICLQCLRVNRIATLGHRCCETCFWSGNLKYIPNEILETPMDEKNWEEAYERIKNNNWTVVQYAQQSHISLDGKQVTFFFSSLLSYFNIQGADLSLIVQPISIADFILHEMTLPDVHHTCPPKIDQLNVATHFQVVTDFVLF